MTCFERAKTGPLQGDTTELIGAIFRPSENRFFISYDDRTPYHAAHTTYRKAAYPGRALDAFEAFPQWSK